MQRQLLLRWGYLAVIATGLVGGCADPSGPQCTLLGCTGGFELWITSTHTTDTFDPGTYGIVLELDEGRFEVECTIEASGRGECGPGDWQTNPKKDFSIVVTYGVPAAQAAIDSPAIQLHIAGRSDAPAGTNVFGPTIVEIEVDRSNRIKGEQSYRPTYERNEEFNGPSACGFCESLEREVLRLDP